MLWLPRRESKTSPPKILPSSQNLVSHGFSKGEDKSLIVISLPQINLSHAFSKAVQAAQVLAEADEGWSLKRWSGRFWGAENWKPFKIPRVLASSQRSKGHLAFFGISVQVFSLPWIKNLGGWKNTPNFVGVKVPMLCPFYEVLQETTILLVRSGGKYQLTLDV